MQLWRRVLPCLPQELLKKSGLLLLVFTALGSSALAVPDESWVPQSGLQLWLKADSLSLANGAAVSSWSDQSGNGNDISQTTAGNQPTYQSNILNGHSAVRFNGTSQYLSGATNSGLTPTTATVIAVYRPLSILSHSQRIISQPHNPAYTSPSVSWSLSAGSPNDTKPKAQFSVASIKYQTLGVDSTPLSVGNMLVSTCDGNVHRFYVNGALVGSTTVAGGISYASPQSFYVGTDLGGEYLNGDVMEVLFYSRALTDQERQNIELYIGNKYGIVTASAQPTLNGLQLWLRADSLALANGASVDQWSDQSGIGNHATQATAANQPTYTASDSLIGNKPSVAFAASDYLSIANASALNPDKITIIAVAKRNAAASGAAMIVDKGADGSAYNLRYGGSPNAANGRVNGSVVGANISAGVYNVLCETYDLVTQQFFINGSIVDTASYSTAIGVNSNPVHIGGRGTNYSLKGGVAEIFIYGRVLTDAERKDIEAYLHTKYGVGAAPVAASPVISVPTGTYATAQTLTMTGPAGAQIYYTLDGSVPTVNSTLYAGPITISQSVTIKAITVKDGYTNSPVWQGNIAIDPATGYIPRSGLQAWFRADSIAQAGGTAVSVWEDQSGNANDATQGTAANQPTLSTSALNGKPAVHFTASSAKYLSVANAAGLNPTQVTVIAVARRATGTGVVMIAEKGNGSAGYSLRFPTGTTAAGYVNSNGAVTPATAPLALGTFNVLTLGYDQSLNRLYQNGSLVDSNAYTTAIATYVNPMTIGGRGANYNLDGDIAELFVYSRAISDAERHDIEAYLYFKYGVGPAVAPTLVVLSGDQQYGMVNQFNTNPFNVAVWNSAGTAPLVGVPVAFTITAGGGQLSSANDGSAPLSASLNLTTDAYGTVNAYYKHGAAPSVTSYIQATSGGASAQIVTYSVADTAAPSIPSGLVASDVATTSFTLSWNASTDDFGVAGYEIFQNEALIGTSTSPSYAVANLAPLTAYSMTVKSKDAAGNLSAASAALSVTTTADTAAPTAPTGLSATNGSVTGFTLNWTASADNVAVTGYDVYQDGVLIGSSSTLSYDVGSLAPSTIYSMTVKAKDAAGNVSAASAALLVATSPDTAAPSAPTALEANEVTTTSFTLNWTASADNVGVTGYDIYKNGSLLGSSPTLSYGVTDLSPGTAYNMTVKAKDAAGNVSVASATLAVTTLTDGQSPTVPTGLTASDLGTTGFTLNWTASTDNIGVAGYDIFKDGVQIGTSVTPTYAVTNLAPLTTYGMTVKARDAAGNVSAASAALSVSTTADTSAPAVPSGLSATSVATTSFTLNWSASSDNVAVTGYDVFKNGVQIGTTATLSYTVVGLAPSTTYNIMVKARDAAGNLSTASGVLSVTTLADTAAPSVPTGLEASSVKMTSFTLSWAASSDNFGVTGYNVYQNEAPQGSGTTGTSLVVTGLASGGTYAFTVKALDAAGNISDASGPLMVTTLAIGDFEDAYMADFDDDGIASGWELEHSLDPYDPTDASLMVGGVTNLTRYQQSLAVGGDPTTSNSVGLVIYTP